MMLPPSLQSALRKLRSLFPVLAVIWGAATVILAIALMPTVTVVRMAQGGQELNRIQPITTSDVRFPITATFSVTRKPWQAQVIRIVPDDCLSLLKINGKTIVSKFCARFQYNRQVLYNIAREGTGATLIEATVVNTFGPPMGISIGIASDDWHAALPQWMAVVLIALLSFAFAYRWISRDALALFILSAGVGARIVYGLSTDYNTRSHEPSAHLEYVMYMSEHWNIPSARGWELHQPPLYYATAGSIARVFRLFGAATDLVPWVQLLSIAFSCGTLLAGLWIGKRLLRQASAYAFPCYAAFIASLPGLVMFSSWISNDTMIAFLTFLGGGLLLLWWEKRSAPLWYALWTLCGLAFLTKLNGLALPFALILTGLAARKPRAPTLAQWTGGIVLFLALTAWLPFVRLHQDSSDIHNFLMTGKSGMSAGLKLKHVPADFLTFNPVAIVQSPFNNPFSDAARRYNVFEYLFRSSLFGEYRSFPVPWLTNAVALLALLSLGWMVYGGMQIVLRRDRDDLPLLMLFLASLLQWLAYLLIFQYSPEQDFRFSPFFAVTAAYLFAIGVVSSAPRFRMLAYWNISLLSLLSILMLIL